MHILVRRATAEDYDPLCELFDEGDVLHRDHLPHIFQQPGGPAREKDYYLGLLADENVALLVAELPATRVAGTGDGGLKPPRGVTLVGYLHAYLRDAPALPMLVPRRYAVVDAVDVRSGLQHQGIGRKLM